MEVLGDLQHQARLFCRYLVGAEPDSTMVGLYEAAIQRSPQHATPADRRLLAFAINNPWSIGLLDGGLALLRPNALLRRRLYVMFAVVESSSRFADKFIARQHSPLYLVVLAFIGVRAALRAAAGMVLIAFVGRA